MSITFKVLRIVQLLFHEFFKSYFAIIKTFHLNFIDTFYSSIAIHEFRFKHFVLLTGFTQGSQSVLRGTLVVPSSPNRSCWDRDATAGARL